MKLHDLRPADGSRRPRRRVGRGIAAGKGKTAGRGTKGQKSRAGSSIPAWFEGGQTPIHVRVPKLRGFRNRFKVAYQVVNVGRVAEYAGAGRFGVEAEASGATPTRAKAKSKSTAPVTVNPALLASAGLVRSDSRPVKILGEGDVEIALFVVADAITQSARRKIEAAGGYVQLLAPVAEPLGSADEATAEFAPATASPSADDAPPTADAAPEEAAPAPAERPADEAGTEEASKPARRSTRRKPSAEE